MGRVFLSYRRSDSEDVVGRIYEHLSATLGSENVFKDVDSIPLGADFYDVIKAAVRSSEILLVVIGPGWLSAEDDRGNLRLQEPDDYVRLEIETALHIDKTVIPVLVRGAKMPSQVDLPESLQRLVRRNAARVRSDPDFKSDIAALSKGIRRFIKPLAYDGRKSHPLTEYLYVDSARLRQYAEQIMGAEFFSERRRSDHELIGALTEHLAAQDQIDMERPRFKIAETSIKSRQFVLEEFRARKMILPARSAQEVDGLNQLAIWVSGPTPEDHNDFKIDGQNGTYLYLIEPHWQHDDRDRLDNQIYGSVYSGYSALMWIIDQQFKEDLINETPPRRHENFNRLLNQHGIDPQRMTSPLKAFEMLGMKAQPERQVRSLYRKRLFTDELFFDMPKWFGLTREAHSFNDLVGYPVYICEA